MAEEGSVCVSSEQLALFVHSLHSYPIPLQLALLQFLSKELPHQICSTDLLEALVHAYGKVVLPFRLLSYDEHSDAEQKLPVESKESELKGTMSTFRRIACVICNSCLFLEFPMCKTHSCLLTQETFDGQVHNKILTA